MALLGEKYNLEDYQTIEPNPYNNEGGTPYPEQEEAPKQPSGRDILMSLYEQKPPKPKFDKTTPEYLKRAAKLNALGRGLSTIGDVFSLSQGGNVNRPTPDNKTGRYVDGYFKYLDNYKDKVDKYNMLDFQNKMRLGQAVAGQANADRSFDASQDRFDENMDYRKGRDKKTDERYEKQFDFQKQQYDEQPERQKEMYRFQSSLQEAKRNNDLQEWIQKETLKLQFDKQKNQYVLYDNAGEPKAAVDDEGQIQKLYHVITSDPAMQDESDAMMELLKAELGEGVTMNHMKIIVSKLWDRSNKAKQYLGLTQPQQGFQVPSMWQNNTQQTTPIDNNTSNTPTPNSRNNGSDVKSKWGSYAR